MPAIVLKNIKKVYPHSGEKKKEKGESEKKSNLQITEEGVLAVQDFDLEIADTEFLVLVGPSGGQRSVLPSAALLCAIPRSF